MTCPKQRPGPSHPPCGVGKKFVVLSVTCMSPGDQAFRFLAFTVPQIPVDAPVPRYNNKTYRVDDIDWDQNPNSTFKKADGSEVSFLEYYRKVRRGLGPGRPERPRGSSLGASGAVAVRRVCEAGPQATLGETGRPGSLQQNQEPHLNLSVRRAGRWGVNPAGGLLAILPLVLSSVFFNLSRGWARV